MATKKATKKATPAKAKKATTTKKAAPKKAAAGAKRKPNLAFMAPWKPSEALAAIVGAAPLPRTEVVKKMWQYIKKNGLQDKRNINTDDRLKALFGKKTITMFEMNSYLSKHLTKI